MPIATFLVRHARLLLAASLFIGIALPPLAALLRPVLAEAVAALLFLSMLRVGWRNLIEHARRPAVVALGLAWLLAGRPLVMWAAVAPLRLPDGIAGALVLMAAAPPITSAPAIAPLLGLDAGLSLILVSLATLLAPLTVPPAAAWLAGAALDFDLVAFTLRISVLIFGSVGAAVLVRAVAGEARVARAAPMVDAGSVLLLLLFAVAIMDGVGPLLLQRPVFVTALVAGSYAANLGLQAVGAAIFARSGRNQALTLGFVGGNCNMAVLLAALPSTADRDTLLWFALAQFPIFTLPALLARPYRWLLVREPRGAARSQAPP
jgi:BASS family bile acid:Na+ symporter